MIQTKLTLFSWFAHGKPNNCRKFTKLKFEDTKCKQDRPNWIWIHLLFWQTESSGEVMEVDKQLKFKSHERMQVEFISNNVGVMTHDCLSSVAPALVYQQAHRTSTYQSTDLWQRVVCHHVYICLSWLMVICQRRPHYISENQTSACQTNM